MPTALIVEDEPQANKLLAMVVRLRGYQTESAFSGNEALAKAVQSPPDVVLLDLMLPDIDGFEVCSVLKSRRATNPVPVVMVSARVAADNRLKGLRVGADDYVPKPYTPDQIFRALSAAEGRRQSLEAQEDRGVFGLGGPTEAESLAAIARLRALLLARTDCDEAEVARLAETLADLGREASRHARELGLERVATVRYRRLPDCLILTLNDDDHWFGPDDSRLSTLRPLFDRSEDSPCGREVVLTKSLGPSPTVRG